MVSKCNQGDIRNFGRFEGLAWEFNKSAGAPWENGYSEALIRLVKRAIVRIIGDYCIIWGAPKCHMGTSKLSYLI